MRRWLIVPTAACLFCGCGDFFGVSCTAILLPNLDVQVRDSATGAPAAQGATGWSDHQSGVRSELLAVDSLRLSGAWNREMTGRYVVFVRKPGYKLATDTTVVTADRCHVKTRTVPVAIAVNPASVEETAIRQVFGSHVNGSSGSAGIRVLGDTLEIVGSAWSRCARLRAVAFRTGASWHIQLEPTVAIPGCSNANLQQFELRYRLLPGSNELLVTSARGSPVVLFQGRMTATP